MANIEINEGVWNGLTDKDKAEITESLKKARLLIGDESIVGNPNIPAPAAGEENWFSDLVNPIVKPACQAVCDAAAIAATAALTLTGPALAAALIVIDAARQECRKRC